MFATVVAEPLIMVFGALASWAIVIFGDTHPVTDRTLPVIIIFGRAASAPCIIGCG
jgi:hypothetical protein